MKDILHILLEIVGFTALSAPLIWEVWNDKDGDSHISRGLIGALFKIPSKKIDIGARVIIMTIAALATWAAGLANPVIAFGMSGAIHFLFFDYIIVYILIQNNIISATAKWYDYLGAKGFDNYEWWRTKAWYWRMAIKIAVFVIVCIIYF